MHHGVRLAAVTIVAAGLLAACENITQRPESDAISAELRGVRVKPDSVHTDGTGVLDGSLLSTNVFNYTLSFEGLSSAATAVHIHGPADTSGVASILVDFAALPAGSEGTMTLGATGSASGTLDLNVQITPGVSGDSLHSLLSAGKAYIDVHTAEHGGGEIRGQLLKQ